jgi:hypothetical protein
MSIDIEQLTIAQAREIAEKFSKCSSQQSQVKGQHIVVTTDKRGVFFGFCQDYTQRPLVLENARMAIYWDKSVGGVLGLSDTGPSPSSRISAVCPSITIEGITSVMSCTETAIKNWKEAKVQGRV